MSLFESGLWIPIVLLALGFLAVPLIGISKWLRQEKKTREFARRYAEAGVTYTSGREGLPTSDLKWKDRVEGVRNGRAFAVRSESRSLFPAQYSAGGALESGGIICHRISVPLARRTPELRICKRHEKNADANSGAVATGFAEFDESFLVFCADPALVREVMTPELISWMSAQPTTETYAEGARGQFGPAQRGIELRGGDLSLEETGGRLEPDRVFAGVDYLDELLARLPAELVPRRQHAVSGEGK